ncbi:MAG: hypothetical protein DMF69_14930 [Acidobacteria bacterium]|nr:MAG: hypothetical protein DMF69_14930 [Acidobacteriota bacterium]
MHLFRQVVIVMLATPALFIISMAQQGARPVKQSVEVVQAYRVCEQFQKVLSQNLDFNAAFEATFTKDKTRQRSIAIKDGEFGDLEYANVDDQTLLNAYKARMQLLYLMFPLASPGDNEEAIFFPPPIKAMFTRKGPRRKSRRTLRTFAHISITLQLSIRVSQKGSVSLRLN